MHECGRVKGNDFKVWTSDCGAGEGGKGSWLLQSTQSEVRLQMVLISGTYFTPTFIKTVHRVPRRVLPSDGKYGSKSLHTFFSKWAQIVFFAVYRAEFWRHGPQRHACLLCLLSLRLCCLKCQKKNTFQKVNGSLIIRRPWREKFHLGT